ncbi:trypsin-like peptidase domain-containing protein [soil metagenome]
MHRLKRFGRTSPGSFVSALVGGVVVALFGWVAVAAGWIEADSATTTGSQAPLTAQQPVASPTGKGLTVGEIYDRVDAGVAFIRASGGSDAQASPFGGSAPNTGATGSGFLIDNDGHVVTNAHVVDGASEFEVTLGDEQKGYDAKLLGQDDSTDIAVLEIDSGDDPVEPLTLGSSGDVAVGDPVVAVGNPFGLDRTVTAGIVSALQRQISAPDGFAISDVIQTDAPINPGNSGGPLLSAAGEVIGVNSQIESTSRGSVGIGFAVPIDTAAEVAQTLISDGEVQHAYLGITGADLDPQLADAMNIDAQQGALVQRVVPDSPADKAGIEAGDVTATVDGAQIRVGGDLITAVDGEPVTGMDDVIAAVNRIQPGDKLELTLVRKGDQRTVTVTLADRPASAQG